LLDLANFYSWNQVILQKSTEEIPGRTTPALDKLYEEFRTFGASLNAKIDNLQIVAASEQNDEDVCELQSMDSLRECVRSAADVVSTASTALSAEASDAGSVHYGSDLGDVFFKDANEPMLRWIASYTVHEYEDMGVASLFSSKSEEFEDPTEYQNDSDPRH
jgi:hypothetical protein